MSSYFGIKNKHSFLWDRGSDRPLRLIVMKFRTQFLGLIIPVEIVDGKNRLNHFYMAAILHI